MKTTWALISMLIVASLAASAQTKPGTVSESGFSISERGSHHKVWERTELVPAPDGQMMELKRSYTELATGMHFKNDKGEWEESQEQIEILPNHAGAMASKGQHKAIFPPEIKSGLLELQTPDGKWLKSRVWGLAYFDSATGESVLLAEVKESEGQVVGDNMVVYADAFTDVIADMQYTYTRAKFEQDVVLREQPPGPEEFGMDPKTTRLQVLTEFVEAPQPTKASRRAGELPDEALNFGGLSIDAGKAFSTTATKNLPQHVPVGKTWGEIEGRTFLIEEVPYRKVENEIKKLPKADRYEGASLQRRGQGKGVLAALKNLIPKRYAKTETQPGIRPRLMARVAPKPQPGFVLDYVTLNTSLTNYVFKGDATYFINGQTMLNGTTVIEGGTVIKYDAAANGYLELVDGSIQCRTSPYRPAVFTSQHDNSVGETISGSSGSPDTIWSVCIFSANGVAEVQLEHVRMSYVAWSIYVYGSSLSIADSQFRHTPNPIYFDGNTATLRNVLLRDVSEIGLFTSVSALDVENLTVNQCGTLLDGYITTSGFTNCLFVSVTNWGASFTGTSNATNANSAAVFQKVGGGEHYLAAGSPYRDVGTTNISASLLAALKTKTTYPPIAYTNTTFTAPMTFNPQAQRDTDTPDLGYHYDPLDFTFGGCHANSNLTFAAGTAVGWFRTTSGWNHAGQGLHLGDKQIGAFTGTVTAPCSWVRLSTVQENDRTAGYGPGGLSGWAGSIANAPEVRARFTRFSMLAGDGNHLRDDNGWLNLRAQDCEFSAGGVGGYVISMYLTNCLFQRTYVAQVGGQGPCNVVMRNCTMLGNYLQLVPAQAYSPTFMVWDSAFDGTILQFNNKATNSSYATYAFNATNSQANAYPINCASNIIAVSSFGWEAGPLGTFYLPTNSSLVNTGSQASAASIGLYHFTTQTNQTKETTSRLDIGYHYVAVNSSGQPLDNDSDNLPDYFEDSNGDGNYNSTIDLADWGDADTDDDGMNDGVEVLQGRNPRASGTASDTANQINLLIHTPLQTP